MMYKYIRTILIPLILLGLWYIFGGYYLFLLLFLYVSLFIMSAIIFLLKFTCPEIEINMINLIYHQGENIKTLFRVNTNNKFITNLIKCDVKIENVFHEIVYEETLWFNTEECLKNFQFLNCGYYKIYIDKIVCYDLFQCFFRKKQVVFQNRFYIFPKLSNEHIKIDKLSTVSHESFEYSSSKKGEDILEIFNIREYQQGDSIKNIHWKLSTKRSKFMVKEGSLPIMPKIQIGMMIPESHLNTNEILERFYKINLFLLKEHIRFEIWQNYEKKFVEVVDENHFRELFKQMLVSLPLYQTSCNHQNTGYVISEKGIEVIS